MTDPNTNQSQRRRAGWSATHIAILVSALGCFSTPFDPAARELPLQPGEASPRQRAMVDSIGEVLAKAMEARSPEDALRIDFAELYAPLNGPQRAFLDAIRALPGADPSVEVASLEDLVRIEDQFVQVRSVSEDDAESDDDRDGDGDGDTERDAEGEFEDGGGRLQQMPLQLMPRTAWRAFTEMNEAMKRDLGRGLVLGSGYRSPANQLFIFVRYMPYYDYSPSKTLPHVSLPGASDHNRPERQGVDFVSEDGVDLQYSDAAAFEHLDEHHWLLEHASEYGFEGEGAAGTSPWHWRFVGRKRS